MPSSTHHSKWLVVTLVLAMVALMVGAAGAQQQVENPDTYVISTITGPQTMDPAWSYDTSSATIIFNVYETLIFPKEDLATEFVPMLATNVPSKADGTISQDGSTYTFHIREGVTFHNGNLLTAQDAKYSFERAIIQDRSGGPVWILLDTILNVGTWDDFVMSVAEDLGMAEQFKQDLEAFKKADDQREAYTETMKEVDIRAFGRLDDHFEIQGNDFIVHLEKPAAYFLSTLVGNWASIADQGWTAANGGWDGTASTWRFFHDPARQDSLLFEEMNGTGPYKFGGWDRTQGRIILNRNEDYWREPADAKTAIFQYIDEFSTRFLLFQQGDADHIYVPRQNIEQVDPLVAQVCTEEQGGEHFTLPENRDQACESTGREDARFRLFKGLGENVNQGTFYQYDINSTSQYIGSGKLDGAGVPPDFFQDINVRKGFSYAFEYETYIEQAWFGEAVQPTGPIPATVPFDNPENPVYFHDMAKAKAEFKLGYGGTGHIEPGPNGTLESRDVLTGDDEIVSMQDGDGTIQAGPNGVLETSALADDEIVVEETGELWDTGFTLTILYNTGNEQRKTASEIYQQNVQSLNDKFVIDVASERWPDYLDDLVAGNLTMFIIGWLEDYHDPHNWVVPYMASFGAFSGFQGQTLLDYAKEHWDPLIEEASVELDTQKRQQLYNELQLRYFKQAPSVVSVQPLGRHYEQLWMKGWLFNPLYPGEYIYNVSK